jgi:membrane protein implicated in regulation of membrane protease activity
MAINDSIDLHYIGATKEPVPRADSKNRRCCRARRLSRWIRLALCRTVEETSAEPGGAASAVPAAGASCRLAIMIIDLVKDLGAWIWLIAGVALVALELVAPGRVFLRVGLAAIAVGVFALLIALPWEAQLVLFVFLAPAFALVGRRASARPAEGSAPAGGNERGRRLIGMIIELGGPIVDGRGRVRIDNTTWRVAGPDMPAGTRVRIVAADGTVLTVRRVGRA